MKKLIFVLILFTCFTLPSYSQSIEITDLSGNGNDKSFTYHFLTSLDVVPVIIDELMKNGISWNNIGIGKLQRINESTRIVVTVYFYKDGKEHGFVYEASHSLPNSHDRDYMTDRSKINYIQYETDVIKNHGYAMKIKTFPENLFLLRETCYWYQTAKDGHELPVTRKVTIINLRKDIDYFLKKL